MQNSFISLLSLIFFIVSCDQDDSENFENHPSTIDELLIKSSDQVNIDGHTLELHTALWRDFMPVSPVDGKNLISINYLVNTDSTRIPSYITLTRQFVIYGDKLWESDYSEESSGTADYLIERISRNGPKWGPDVEVTVLAEVKCLKHDTFYYVRSDDQNIGKTY